MSRKIHSNSRIDTVVRIQQYFRKAKTYFRKLLHRYPLSIFLMMVVCILLSGILAFTVMRVKEPGGIPVFPKAPVIGADIEIAGVVQTYDALREVSEIQRVIQSIIEKDSLNTADSVLLISALKRFDELQHTKPSKQNNKP